MQVTVFRYSGRFAHFLRAEATANALTYPFPPRTVLLGLTGAILGLSKDTTQDVLAQARFAVGGPVPKKMWHKANMRKTLPGPLGFRVKKSERGSSKEETNTRVPQEWLWKPQFEVWAALGESHHDEFASRVHDRRWHFTPCLGLSELLAHVEWIRDATAERAPAGLHHVSTAIPLDEVEVDKTAHSKGLAIQKIRMPNNVTAERVFSHANYLIERDGRPIPIISSNVWQIANDAVMFL